MTNGDSYRHSWTQAEAFSFYDERRSVVAPALSKLINETFSDNLDEGNTILEIGAGGGALSYYGDDSVDRYKWIESDQNSNFLTLQRPRELAKLAIALPDIALKPESLDAIVGLGVLDTFSTKDLEGTANSAAETLRDGGRLIHLLDMSPDYLAEIRIAENERLFPLITKNGEEMGDLGLVFVDKKNLPRRISRLPIPSSVRNVFGSLVADPDKYVPLVNRTGVLQYLGDIVQELGIVVKKHPSWYGYLGERLERAFESVGFEVEKNLLKTTSLEVDETMLHESLQGKKVTRIERTRGFVTAYADEKDGDWNHLINMSTDSHIFIAINNGGLSSSRTIKNAA
jgi:hypothetical protein